MGLKSCPAPSGLSRRKPSRCRRSRDAAHGHPRASKGLDTGWQRRAFRSYGKDVSGTHRSTHRIKAVIVRVMALKDKE